MRDDFDFEKRCYYVMSVLEIVDQWCCETKESKRFLNRIPVK